MKPEKKQKTSEPSNQEDSNSVESPLTFIAEDDLVVHPFSPPPVTCQAYTVKCFMNNGVFRNFKISKLTIVDGVVTKEELSDPYASFETQAKIEIEMDRAIIHLNNRWQDGKALGTV